MVPNNNDFSFVKINDMWNEPINAQLDSKDKESKEETTKTADTAETAETAETVETAETAETAATEKGEGSSQEITRCRAERDQIPTSHGYARLQFQNKTCPKFPSSWR